MGTKTFVLIFVLLVVTFTATMAVRYLQPVSTAEVSFDSFPLEKEGWTGFREAVPGYVMDLLQPKEIFSGTYISDSGVRIHLLFDFFASGSSFGGPHSPRNCLPGSGWVISGTEPREFDGGNRAIQTGRLSLQYGEESHLMDFWYVTEYGETANDYAFKFFSMLSSLTFKPRDVAFVRFVAPDTEEGRAAMDEFQSLFVPEIYAVMPFEY